jgi:hypothetical protein
VCFVVVQVFIMNDTAVMTPDTTLTMGCYASGHWCLPGTALMMAGIEHELFPHFDRVKVKVVCFCYSVLCCKLCDCDF